MGRYDYECRNCGNMQEEIHSMVSRPVVHCNKCRGLCDKLICGDVQFCGVDGTAQMYNFVEHNTTGKPFVCKGRRHWKEHLKSKGLTDDIPQSTPKEGSLKLMRSEKSKEAKRKEYKESVASALKETGILQKYGK